VGVIKTKLNLLLVVRRISRALDLAPLIRTLKAISSAVLIQKGYISSDGVALLGVENGFMQLVVR
tara:strand:- start:468 stop:662 length:195 start_codon:yes stop_codon:yes gene_type:complete